MDRSKLFLILANLAPALGVLFFGWDAFTIVFLYWMENAVIGLFNVFKMALAVGGMQSLMASAMHRQGVPEEAARQVLESAAGEAPDGKFAQAGMKLFLIPFFCVHYGIFMLVHGVFVFVLLRGPDEMTDTREAMFSLASLGMIAALAALVAEHAFEFVTGFVKSGRYKTVSPIVQMFAPYGRIVVMHLAILGGAFLVVALRLPQLTVLLLVALKIASELGISKLFQTLRSRGCRTR